MVTPGGREGDVGRLPVVRGDAHPEPEGVVVHSIWLVYVGHRAPGTPHREPFGPSPMYQAGCSCGWRAPNHLPKLAAQDAAWRHWRPRAR